MIHHDCAVWWMRDHHHVVTIYHYRNVICTIHCIYHCTLDAVVNDRIPVLMTHHHRTVVSDRKISRFSWSPYYRLFDEARGSKAWVSLVGYSKVGIHDPGSSPCHFGLSEMNREEAQAIPLSRQHKDTYCVADSLLNLLNEPLGSKLEAAVYKLGTHTTVKVAFYWTLFPNE